MKFRWLLSALLVVGLLIAALPGQAQDEQPVVEACAAPSWTGEFYPNNSMVGTPYYILCRRLIDFYWGDGAPFVNIDVDNFSSRWTTRSAFPNQGTYQFKVRVDGGGAALYINGQMVINALGMVGPQVLTANYAITTPGQVLDLKLEHAHYTGNAYLFLDWSLIEGATPEVLNDHRATSTLGVTEFSAGGGNVWFIEHFSNTTLSGPATITNIHVADGISYDYEYGPPEPEVPADGWSSRWTRTVDFVKTATYTFYLRANDAARLTVDGVEVVGFSNNGVGSIYLPQGRHTLVVEHFDIGDEASIFLTWDPPVGTMLWPDGCNAVYTAGVNGNAPICPDRGIATFTYP